MDIQRFYQIIDEGIITDNTGKENLKELVEEYPFFQAATFAYLKSLYTTNDDDYTKELERLSIGINNRKALFYFIFSDEYSLFFQETGKKEIREDKTSVLLSAFFESRDDLNLDLEYTISHSSIASTDYISYAKNLVLEKEIIVQNEQKNENNLKHQSIIDSFLNKSEEGDIRIHIKSENIERENNKWEKEDESEEELTDDIFFTETLAKIYIKQKKYEKAHKIIKHLSLNYPKKNIYFADQLSFLEKLIINTKFKDKK